MAFRQTPTPIILGRPTVYCKSNHSVNGSVELLRNTMARPFGPDHTEIILTLCTCCNSQRQAIVRAFEAKYGIELSAELARQLSGDFAAVVLALIQTPDHFDAAQIHRAMAGLGTKESVLIEILVTRNNAQIAAIKSAYRRVYGRELESALASETSGAFRSLLLAICAQPRDENKNVDARAVERDACALGRGADAAFVEIFAGRSFYHLRAVFDAFAALSGGVALETAIQREWRGDFRDALLAVAKCVRNRAAFFAELIHNAMKGFGTRDSDLIRLVVSRAEIDLADIRDAFLHQYKVRLESAVADECSGAYRAALVALVRGN